MTVDVESATLQTLMLHVGNKALAATRTMKGRNSAKIQLTALLARSTLPTSLS